MATEVKVPDIGDFTDVPVISILVSVGDSVAKEDPLIELESDKATMEVPSSAAGTVKEIKVSEGDKVSEGAVILLLEESDAGDAGGGKEEPKAEKAEAPKQEQAAAAPAPAASPAPVMDAGFNKAHASPSVRAFARNLGVDLSKINGTGRKGRILREDVTKAFKASAPVAAVGTGGGGMGIPPIPAVDFSKFGPVENVEMPRIKKLSGPALHRSWLNIPHVTHNEEADITDLDGYRKELDTQAK